MQEPDLWANISYVGGHYDFAHVIKLLCVSRLDVLEKV
jgi:hypothetical protein